MNHVFSVLLSSGTESKSTVETRRRWTFLPEQKSCLLKSHPSVPELIRPLKFCVSGTIAHHFLFAPDRRGSQDLGGLSSCTTSTLFIIQQTADAVVCEDPLCHPGQGFSYCQKRSQVLQRLESGAHIQQPPYVYCSDSISVCVEIEGLHVPSQSQKILNITMWGNCHFITIFIIFCEEKFSRKFKINLWLKVDVIPVVSIFSFKSSSTQHDAYLVNYHHLESNRP